MPEHIELLPENNELLQPAFETYEDYERFQANFYEQVKPELEELAQARRQSEQDSLRRWYC